MKNVLVSFLLILSLSFIQATVFSFNLVLLTVLSLAVLLTPRLGLFWAFLAGVILDLITGQPLGFSSLIFLALAFLLNLYKTKFKATNFIYLLPFTLFSTWFFNLLKGEPLFFLNVIGTTILLFLVWPLLNLLIGQKDDTNLQLPLKI